MTDGNPFLIEEVLKTLSARPGVFSAQADWDKSIEEMVIPRSVQDAVLRRSARLSEGAIRAAGVCSAGRPPEANMLQPRIEDRRPLLLTLTSLIALAWLALLLWGYSPYGGFLSHQALRDIHLGADGEYLGILALFVGGWTLMTVAMMLPTSLPLVLLFERLVRFRQNSKGLVALLLLGYLSVWTAFGALAHLGDLGIHEVVERAHWAEENAWLLSAAPLLLAGVYQFTSPKYFCWEKCRSPLSFITEHWRGGREGAQAFRLGLHHGVFCVGCCWSLMLLMFTVGIGILRWMLALGTVMAVEKNMPWGRRLSAPLGVLLLASGLALVSVHLADLPATIRSGH